MHHEIKIAGEILQGLTPTTAPVLPGVHIFGRSRPAKSLVVRKNGAIESLAVTGPALGFPHVAPMREGYAVLSPGDGLVMYTDGVTDAGPSPDEFFDVAGIQATIPRLWTRDVVTICDGLLDEVVRHGGGVVSDDATVVVVKFE